MTSSFIEDGEIAKAEQIIDQLFCDTINLDLDFGMEDIPTDDVINDDAIEEFESLIEEKEVHLRQSVRVDKTWRLISKCLR